VRWLLLLALALPAPLVALLSARVADVAGRALGAELGRAAAVMLVVPRVEPLLQSVLAEVTTAEPVELVGGPAPKRSKRRAAGSNGASQAPRGLFVSAPVVLRLANRGVRPNGVAVPATRERPAGVMLVGVARLGIGLRDGDVLTHAAGIPARDVWGVVTAVLSARGRGARTISGHFWRDGAEWTLVVEQPYPERERASAWASLRASRP
jgi:hypothetical protein